MKNCETTTRKLRISQQKKIKAYLLYLFCKLCLNVSSSLAIFSSLSSMILPVVPFPRNFINPEKQLNLDLTPPRKICLLASFGHEPNDSWKVEQKCLKDEENGHPLIIWVVHRVVWLIFTSALALKVSWNIESAVHPTVRFQHFFTHCFSWLKNKLKSRSVIFWEKHPYFPAKSFSTPAIKSFVYNNFFNWTRKHSSALTKSHWIGSPKSWLQVTKTENPLSKVTDLEESTAVYLTFPLKNTFLILPLVKQLESPVVDGKLLVPQK